MHMLKNNDFKQNVFKSYFKFHRSYYSNNSSIIPIMISGMWLHVR
jgi:hypothetical protein